MSLGSQSQCSIIFVLQFIRNVHWEDNCTSNCMVQCSAVQHGAPYFAVYTSALRCDVNAGLCKRLEFISCNVWVTRNCYPVLPLIIYSALLYSSQLYCTLLYSTLLYSSLLQYTLLQSTLVHSSLFYSFLTILYSTLLYIAQISSFKYYSALLY